MRRVIVCQDKNYGASKASATKNTALSPVDLAEGAVGIYGIPNTSANNKDKMALVTNGGSDAAGLVPDAAFDGNSVFVNVGTANGCQSSDALEPAGRVQFTAQAYVAPVAQVVDIALTLNATIAKNEESQVRVTDQENLDQGGSIYSEHINSNVNTIASPSAYWLAWNHQLDLNGRLTKNWVSVDVTSTTAGAVFATSATVAAVKGATSLTTSAAHGVGVGDYVRLLNDTYLAVTGTASTTLVLDRPYQGATGTIANANTKDLGTDPGSIGLKLTSLVQGRNFGISVDGVIADSTIVVTTAGSVGHGAGNLVQQLENLALGYKGSTAGKTDATMPIDSLKAVTTQTYDLYTFISKKVDNIATGGTARHAHNLYDELIVAFPATPSNDGQTDFEAVLGEVLYGAANLGGI